MRAEATPQEHPAERRAIRVRGLVQGVGFRPHVYRCAQACAVSGFVCNDAQGVLIEAEGHDLDAFVELLQCELPPLARLDSLLQQPVPARGDNDFHIAPSRGGAARGAAIPADAAICDDCLQELFDPGDRRYRHPFIACCNCGPRYTMTRALPYDRCHTAMADFDLCPACASEYTDPGNRRFHAEPLACHDCGPQLSNSVEAVARALAAGQIVAIKGVGGYHLACDARNDATVRQLRSRKQRDGKPFAVMVLNTRCAARYSELDEGAVRALRSPERPVTVAPVNTGKPGLSAELSRDLGTLGIMLPYTAVHYLLFHALLGCPDTSRWLREANDIALVMTSANISGEPLITDAVTAEARLGGIADCFLHHNREIPARADDSVVRASARQYTVIRRARGFAPHAIKLHSNGPAVLALGAHLKTTVTLTRGNRAHISPHVGDLDTAEAIALHRETANALEQMLQTAPQRVACDMADDFASTRLATQLSEQRDLPLLRVQHHHAHVAAVLAEHRVTGPVLGMALDGHGQGLDGAAWGGELLRVDGAEMQRVGHLSALSLPGGDRAAREPWRMAAGILHRLDRSDEIADRFRDQPLAAALGQWLRTGETGDTTSAGRLFDTAAGLLGICPVSRFEGEAPMLLEGLVRGELKDGDHYQLLDGILDFTPLLTRLADCADPTRGAREFHGTLLRGLTDWALDAAARQRVDTIALCGGCFINHYLATELPLRLQAAGLTVLQAVAMPPNDGAISLGQAWVACHHETTRA